MGVARDMLVLENTLKECTKNVNFLRFFYHNAMSGIARDTREEERDRIRALYRQTVGEVPEGY